MKEMNNIRLRSIDEATIADIQYTPTSVARQLIDITTIQGTSILDPCSGKGAFYDAFPDDMVKAYCEIEMGSDFFDWTEPVHWVISNPPFSQLTRWIEHTLNVATVGFAYIMPTYSLTHQRLRLIESFGFYCEKTVIIENPKQWNVGFAMGYYVFKKHGQRHTRLVGDREALQARLW